MSAELPTMCPHGMIYKECPSIACKTRWRSFAEARGSASPEMRAIELREAMDAMEQEAWEEYQEYVKRCDGLPVSKIPASRPVKPNEKVSYHADNSGGAHGKDTNDK